MLCANFINSKTACGTPAWPADPCSGEKFEYKSNILVWTVPSVAVLWLVRIQFVYDVGPYSVLSQFSP